jgi:hypothetical protein
VWVIEFRKMGKSKQVFHRVQQNNPKKEEFAF